MSPISALKILLLVNSFMQISVDIYNEPFTIKCCAMYDPTKALLYIYWLLMINTLFVEWISRQNQLLRPKYLVEETFNHLPGNEKDQLSPICSCGTWRLETLPYDDTQSQSIYKRTWKRGKTPERNSTTCEWISPTCRWKPERQCSTTIYCQCNLIFHVRKKNHCIHYLTGQNPGLSGQKIIWPVIMTGDLLSVILSPESTALSSSLHSTCVYVSHYDTRKLSISERTLYTPVASKTWFALYDC